MHNLEEDLFGVPPSFFPFICADEGPRAWREVYLLSPHPFPLHSLLVHDLCHGMNFWNSLLNFERCRLHQSCRCDWCWEDRSLVSGVGRGDCPASVGTRAIIVILFSFQVLFSPTLAPKAICMQAKSTVKCLTVAVASVAAAQAKAAEVLTTLPTTSPYFHSSRLFFWNFVIISILLFILSRHLGRSSHVTTKSGTFPLPFSFWAYQTC